MWKGTGLVISEYNFVSVDFMVTGAELVEWDFIKKEGGNDRAGWSDHL
jgi:hypothetical protein